VAERFRDILDASAVVERIDDAVFTIVSEGGQDTGFGIRSSGGKTWIATNQHVIEGSVRGARVIVRSGFASLHGTVERWDRSLDVALYQGRRHAARAGQRVRGRTSAGRRRRRPCLRIPVRARWHRHGRDRLGLPPYLHPRQLHPDRRTRSIPGPEARSSTRTATSSA
jgi:hypothetical protein